MLRGLISGLFWGALVSVTGLGIASLMLPSSKNMVQSQAPDVDKTSKAPAPEATTDAPELATGEAPLPQVVMNEDGAVVIKDENTPENKPEGMAKAKLGDIDQDGVVVGTGPAEGQRAAKPNITIGEEAVPNEVRPKHVRLNDKPAGTPAGTIKPESSIMEREDEIASTRLPQIKAAPSDAGSDLSSQSLGVLSKYGAAFEPEDPTKALFSIVLLDDGTALDEAALADLPFAVSFVVDPLLETAKANAAKYAAAGFDVIVKLNLPTGARPENLEEALESYKRDYPNFVGVLDVGFGGFKGNQQVANHFAAATKGMYYGYLGPKVGLNSAYRKLQQEGIPASLFFRWLDEDSEKAPRISRYLDRAAFEASKNGQVIVLGTTRPETLGAIINWAVKGNAANVNLAPISGLWINDIVAEAEQEN